MQGIPVGSPPGAELLTKRLFQGFWRGSMQPALRTPRRAGNCRATHGMSAGRRCSQWELQPPESLPAASCRHVKAGVGAYTTMKQAVGRHSIHWWQWMDLNLRSDANNGACWQSQADVPAVDRVIARLNRIGIGRSQKINLLLTSAKQFACMVQVSRGSAGLTSAIGTRATFASCTREPAGANKAHRIHHQMANTMLVFVA